MKHTKKICVNFILDNGNVHPSDESLLFENEKVKIVEPTLTMVDLLVLGELFPSKGQARKNGIIRLVLSDGTLGKCRAESFEIPDGFTELLVGKLKHEVTIWNPSEVLLEEVTVNQRSKFTSVAMITMLLLVTFGVGYGIGFILELL